jgi:hypothetical protein
VIGESCSGEFDVNVGVLEVGTDAFLQEEQLHGVTSKPTRNRDDVRTLQLRSPTVWGFAINLSIPV